MQNWFLNGLLSLALGFFLAACKNSENNGGGQGNSSPTPAPTAIPLNRPDLSASCQRLGDGVATARCSPKGRWHLMKKMVEMLFDVDRSLLDRGGRPTEDPQKFVQWVYDRMDALGICAVYDGEKFLLTDGTHHENYTIYHTGNFAPFVEAYSSCDLSPKFAQWDGTTMKWTVPQCDLQPMPPQSTSVCTRSADLGGPGEFFPKADAAIDELIQWEKQDPTDMFDFNRVENGDWYAIKDTEANKARYLESIAGVLRASGHCVWRSVGTQDGIEVKKGSNEFSEYFDLIMGRPDGVYIRRYFHSQCVPAGF